MLARGWVLLVLAGATSGTVACEREAGVPPAASAPALRVTDDAGRVVELTAPAQRVICLMPAVTDMLLAFGAADRLIARTQWDTDPRLKDLPTTGNALTPSLEWIASLDADLVIAWPDQGSRAMVARLGELGIPTYSARTESIVDALRTSRNLGVLLGLGAQADSAARWIESELALVRGAVAPMRRVAVAYILSIDPPMIAGPSTFIGELITIAGGENVFGDVSALWPQVNIEELIRRRPEALVVAQESGADPTDRLKRLPGWRELDAVRSGRVLVVDVNRFNRPGPTIPQSARELARFLHPQAKL